MADREPAARLVAVLADVRAALRDGNYEAIKPLVARQDRLFEHLQWSGLRADGTGMRILENIRTQAARNQHLIKSAGEGLKSAHRRGREIQAARARTDIYDRTGQKVTIARPGTDLERRS